jgi:ribosomal protein S18 acetylase RimI-like enzyme
MADEDFQLREGSPEDFPALARIDASVSTEWVLHIERIGEQPEQRLDFAWRQVKSAGSERRIGIDGIVEELETEWKRSDRLFIAEMNGVAAGYLMLGTNWNKTAELTLIIVGSTSRRRGIGRRFVQEAEAYARERRLRGLQWEVQNDNRDAIQFALSQGFRVAGFHDALYRNDDLARQTAPDFQGIALFLTKTLE